MTHTMTRDEFDTFAATAKKYNGYPRDSYSGRFMYGKSCVGVDFDSLNDFVEFRMAIGQKLPDFDWSAMTTDSMGLGMVYYWKQIPVEQEEE